MLELDYKGVGSFLTLTYSPDEEEASYRDVQLFAKRIRFNNPDWDFSYITRGELGEKFGRFHWHMLAFGWREIWPDGINHIDEWEHGHVHTGELNAQTAAYLYSYTMKDNIWGETRYSSRPCIGWHGMMQMAEIQARYSKYAISAGNFSVGGVKYPMGYHMKQTIEKRMEELGCIEVPPMNADQLFESVVEYRQKSWHGAYDRTRDWQKDSVIKSGPKERRHIGP